MTSGFICIHQGEDGTVCGKPDLRPMTDGYAMRHALWVRPAHPFVPGRKCPTCDGYGKVENGWAPSIEHVPDCPTCAASPVRGYHAL